MDKARLSGQDIYLVIDDRRSVVKDRLAGQANES